VTFLLEIVRLGLGNLRRHLLRSFLTALGIILGVAAVITNAAIGEGSKREALAQLERLGATNIIVRSTKPPEPASGGGQRRAWTVRYGLTRDDLRVIRAEFEGAEAIVPLKAVGGQVLRESIRRTSQAFGTTPDLRSAARLRVSRGRYLTLTDMEDRAKVAVVGATVARQLFGIEDPIGQTLRIDAQTFLVVGVLEPVGLAGGAGAQLVGRDLNEDVHIPLTTAEEVFGDTVFRATAGAMASEAVQVSEVYLVVPDRGQVLAYDARLRRLLESRRPGLPDISIFVPLELLEEANRTSFTWNLVLTAIAGISLLVGGIGIMNIMLASVTERTREIGIRRALGATRRHIVSQFLVETGVLSAVGAMVGVVIGVSLSVSIPWLTRSLLPNLPVIGQHFSTEINLPTALTPWSILIAFGVAAMTGVVFGLYPAVRASRQDPIVALRHD
jgi:putative ABC transport system permease protein